MRMGFFVGLLGICPHIKEEFFMKKTYFTTRRITFNAIMIALFVCLAFFQFIIAGVKVTFEDFPVIICAIIFGPLDAAIVGFLGKFLEQLLTYGLTPTTILWILPAVVRALFIGFCLLPIKKRFTQEHIFRSVRIVWVFIICGISGALAAALNTLAYYVDSKMLGYYDYKLVLGVFWIRISLGIAFSTIMAAITSPIALALKRAKLIK